jgi:hypothetical protein
MLVRSADGFGKAVLARHPVPCGRLLNAASSLVVCHSNSHASARVSAPFWATRRGNDTILAPAAFTVHDAARLVRVTGGAYRRAR